MTKPKLKYLANVLNTLDNAKCMCYNVRVKTRTARLQGVSLITPKITCFYNFNKWVIFMVNNTEQRLLIITEQDAEIINIVDVGEVINIRSVKQAQNDKYYSPKIKLTNGRFVKVMDKEKEIRDKFVKYPATYFALNVLKHYLQYNTNLVMKDGKKYKCVDLANEMGITRQMASIHLKRLQEHNLIAEVPTNRGMFWAINPDYYRRGEEVPKIVKDLFDKKLNI